MFFSANRCGTMFTQEKYSAYFLRKERNASWQNWDGVLNDRHLAFIKRTSEADVWAATQLGMLSLYILRAYLLSGVHFKHRQYESCRWLCWKWRKKPEIKELDEMRMERTETHLQLMTLWNSVAPFFPWHSATSPQEWVKKSLGFTSSFENCNANTPPSHLHFCLCLRRSSRRWADKAASCMLLGVDSSATPCSSSYMPLVCV